MGTPFTKVEGLGNDFLLVDRRRSDKGAIEGELPAWAARAPAICHRRRGVGADGILLVGPGQSPGAGATMYVINHDGSRPEMCGNGVRCVAKWAAPGEPIVIDTDAGPKACRPVGAQIAVDMGIAQDGGFVHPECSPIPLRVVSMGNPHAIALVTEDPEALCRRHGPGIETAEAFPDRTNVEFARREPDGSLTLWVWERGCGITDACGTGACATAAAAVWGDAAVRNAATVVHLPGGDLTIVIDGADRVEMTGPASMVFVGELR